jgi:glycosyltransferase involved in cell wall biosynthesis
MQAVTTTIDTPMETNRAVAPKILGLSVFGPPFAPGSWSGSARSLFCHLRDKGNLVEAHSVDLTTVQKLMSVASRPALDRRKLYLNVMKNKVSFGLRSANARRIIENADQNYNVILQLGALFCPPIRDGVLHCSYHDGNTAVSRRSEYSYVKASRRVLAESWQNEQGFYRRVHLIFTMSEWLRQSMIQDFGANPDNVFAVGAGPNLSYAQELIDSSRTESRHRNKTILFVGVDFDGKGGPMLIEVFRRVRKQVPDAKLQIVGCTVPLDEPGVEVIGVLDKSDPRQEARLRQLYEEASVFALPTRFDCFGIAFVEAMYHRLPCVGSDICAIPEIIRDGETGFTVPPQDASQWADKLVQLLRDVRLSTSMGNCGFQYAIAKYNWQFVVDRMLKAMSSRLA